jgi:hypothetical protein|tara:strand:+ start:227 stop:418 length:192 start_codon:yes stop_codon:yes gene_type:complete
MGNDYDCGCRRDIYGKWTLCDKHEVEFESKLEPINDNTIADVVRNKKGKIKKFVNERPMRDAK